MKVTGLVGLSGSGKSYRALSLAHERDIDYIIDDGLLIMGNKVIAGKSAKREDTAVGAVKTALFSKDEHRELVKNAIKKVKPKGVLIIGTSTRMVDKIAHELEISPIQDYVFIEDISTEEERKIAQKQRKELGKHVIPVPTFEIKKDFSGYFLDPLKILRRRKDNSLQVSEKSVVRPTYSYLGKYTISDKVICELVTFATSKVIGIYKTTSIDVNNYTNGIIINMEVIMVYGNPIQNLSKILQEQVKYEVENMTSLNIIAINIIIKGLIIN